MGEAVAFFNFGRDPNGGGATNGRSSDLKCPGTGGPLSGYARNSRSVGALYGPL